MTYTRTNIRDRIIDVAEDLGWSVSFGTQTRIDPVTQEQVEESYAEFERYSPAGEDFGFTVFFDMDEDITREVSSYAEDFDIDEHVEMWVQAKANGGQGIPSVRELVDDAEDIKEMLCDLAKGLEENPLEKYSAVAAMLGWGLSLVSTPKDGSIDTFVEFRRAKEDFSFCVHFDSISDIPAQVNAYASEFSILEFVTGDRDSKKTFAELESDPETKDCLDKAENIALCLNELAGSLLAV